MSVSIVREVSGSQENQEVMSDCVTLTPNINE
jgi:hypothetical protein